MELKEIVKGTADMVSVMSGGIATYKLTDINGKNYLVDIDLSNKDDVGTTAVFMVHYDKSITLMRWIRRAIENNTLIQL